MVMVMRVMVILAHQRAVLCCPPGSGVIFSACSGIVLVVGNFAIPWPPSQSPRPVETVFKRNNTAAAVLLWTFRSSSTPSDFALSFFDGRTRIPRCFPRADPPMYRDHGGARSGVVHCSLDPPVVAEFRISSRSAGTTDAKCGRPSHLGTHQTLIFVNQIHSLRSPE